MLGAIVTSAADGTAIGAMTAVGGAGTTITGAGITVGATTDAIATAIGATTAVGGAGTATIADVIVGLTNVA